MEKTKNAIVILLLTFLLTPFDSEAVSTFEGNDNDPAPNFTIKDLAGRDVTLSSFKGKVVLLNFWATWCLPCRDEMRSIETLYKAYKGKDLVILGVSIDIGPGSISRVKDFVEKNRLSFTILTDPDIKVGTAYKVFALPTSILIDRKGKIIKRFIGDMDWADAEQRKNIDDTLSE